MSASNPLNKTFRVHTQFIPTQKDSQGVISVNVGDEGTTSPRPVDCNANWIKVWVAGSGKVGTIPRNVITIGVTPGEYTVVGAYPKVPNAPQLQVGGTHSILQKAITALFEEIANNIPALITLGAEETVLDDMMNPNMEYGRLIYQGIPSNMLNRISTGVFSLQQLFQLNGMDDRSTGCGIYALIYRLGNVWWVYIGQTMDFGGRFGQHRRKITGTHVIRGGRNHYDISRQADAWKMVPVVVFNQPAPNLLKVAEHTMVSLFNSWNQKVLRAPQTIGDLGARLPHFSAARFSRDLAQRAFLRAGWTIRSDNGCNWSTPLMESSLNIVTWTSVNINNMRVFRRPAVSVSSNGTALTVQIIGSQRSKVVLMLSNDQTCYQVGDRVHVVCEITSDFRPHPVPFCRLPEIGPLSDSGRARALGKPQSSQFMSLDTESDPPGIRIEKPDANGQWQSRWVQVRRNFQTPASRIAGEEYASRPYAKATHIINTLMRARYPDGAVLPSYLRPPHPVIVKIATRDYLLQQITVTDAPMTQVSVPVVRSILDNEQRMKNRYPGITTGLMPLTFPLLSVGRRILCDYCYIVSFSRKAVDFPY
jgi:hypothetical protein